MGVMLIVTIRREGSWRWRASWEGRRCRREVGARIVSNWWRTALRVRTGVPTIEARRLSGRVGNRSRLTSGRRSSRRRHPRSRTRTLARRTRRTSTLSREASIRLREEVHGALRLMDSGNVVDISLDLVLHVRPRVICSSPLRRRRAALASEPNVLVGSDLFFAETEQDFALLMLQILHPIAHILQHFTLDFRVGVVEVRMEAARNKED